jgi:alcohol dehydrogenase class IV
MVSPFQFARLPLIYFGSGKRSLLPGLIRQYGSTIILVAGRSSFMDSVNASTLLESLRTRGIVYHVVNVGGEPSPDLIDDTVTKFRDTCPAAVVSIGGGSVVDAGKAISAMMKMPDPVINYLEVIGTKEHPGTKIPFIAIPTTSGTGSEATKNAVLSSIGRNGFKRSLRHDNFVPDIAVIDPELTLECPQDITSASGTDCFTQLVESFLSVKACAYTDALAVEGLKAIKRSLLRSYTDGSDLGARTDMSFAALTSGICLANAGLGSVHGLAGTIGGLYSIPHGLVCGTLMAVANEVNVRELRQEAPGSEALAKYATLGKIFIDGAGRSEDYYIDGFISYLHELTDALELPGLRKYGLNQNDIRIISSETDNKNNPVRLSPDVLVEIISRRLV